MKENNSNLNNKLNIKKINSQDITKNNKKQIIFDTNFLFIPFKFKMDIISELDRVAHTYELFIIDKTLEELEKIQKTKTKKDRKYINLIIKFINLYNFKLIQTTSTQGKYVDEILLNLTKNNDLLIATMDKELREKIKNLSKKCLIFRQKSYLEIS